MGFTTGGSPPPVGQPKTPGYKTARYWLRELAAQPYSRLTLARRFAALNQYTESPLQASARSVDGKRATFAAKYEQKIIQGGRSQGATLPPMVNQTLPET